MVKVSDYVFDFVATLGVGEVFMLPGGGCMHLTDSLGRSEKLEAVGMLQEQPVAIATDAYSQYSGNIGVALVTSGPGSTNTITGVTASWIDSTPVLVISGQVKTADSMEGRGVRQMGIQEVDITSIVGPITKYAERVKKPDKIRKCLEKAVFLARSGRKGPVWVDIPLDVQGAEIEPSELEGYDSGKDAEDGEGKRKELKKKVDEVVRILREAERPVILGGNGIRLAGASGEFRELAEKLGIPILLTWKAMDLLEEEYPLLFGRPGAIAQRYANLIQQNADVLITIGARLDYGQIGFDHSNFAPNAKKIIVDIDKAEIKKLNCKVSLPVVADAGEFIRELLSRAEEIGRGAGEDGGKGDGGGSGGGRGEGWIAKCKEWKERYPLMLPEYKKDAEYASTYALIDALSERMGEEDIFVPASSGAASEISQQAFRVKRGQRVFCSPGLGSMGFGLSAMIGAAVASKGRVVCVEGDGGAQMNLQELQTLKRLSPDAKYFVLNNDGYGSIRNTHRRFFEGRLVSTDSSSNLTFPSLGKIAGAYGIKYYRIGKNSEMGRVVREMLSEKGPALCEVMIDPDEKTKPRMMSEVLPDGSMRSSSFEDLWPFLGREEFEARMNFPEGKKGKPA